MMTTATALALTRYFAEERGVSLTDAEAASRRTLAALLTTRPPAPIRADVAAAVDALLGDEAKNSPTVDVTSLPTLAHEQLAQGIFGQRVRLWRGDLTMLAADAVVNAANSALLGCFIPGHACIDNRMHALAGPALRAACAEHIHEQGHDEAAGGATITPGFHLPAAWVIHTVGPMVPGGIPSAQDAATLASCYRAILDAAAAHGGIRTVGFCAIATGVFGYPKVDGARVAVRTISAWLRAHPESDIEPVLSAYTEYDFDVYAAVIAEEQP